MARISASLNVTNAAIYSFSNSSHVLDTSGATADVMVSVNIATVKNIGCLRAAFEEILLKFRGSNYLRP